MKEVILYDTAGIVAGFLLDCLFGDPAGRFHPVCFIGRLIDALTKSLLDKDDTDLKKLYNGLTLVVVVLSVTFIAAASILLAAYKIHPVFGFIMGALMSDAVMAAKDLQTESMRVGSALKEAKALASDNKGPVDLSEARKALGMIVGRDTDKLDEHGIIRATVETVAENTSDGVGAPLFYLCLGGPVLAFIYKAINTMDSMIGYKNDKFMYFGRVAAKLDDVANYIPARISAFFYGISAFICNYDAKGAFAILRRDGRKSESPNAALCEAACAGALDVTLLGDAYYFGELKHKDKIGDDIRPIESEDIKRANIMMRITSLLWLFLLITLRGILLIVMYLD